MIYVLTKENVYVDNAFVIKVGQDQIVAVQLIMELVLIQIILVFYVMVMVDVSVENACKFKFVIFLKK